MRELSYLAIRLKEARKNAGLSAAEAGSRLNRSASAIYAWENGNAEPSPELLIALCYLYGVDITFFYPPELASKLSATERTIIERYRKMTDDNKAVFFGLSEILTK